MIYTVTLVPSVDYTVSVKDFMVGKINFGENDMVTPGGKGVNVSIILARLGIKTIATGFIAGFTGKYIKHELNALGVANDFIEIPGISRVNMKVCGGDETAINGSGPSINDKQIEELINKLKDLDSEDILVISGSLPNYLDEYTYAKMVEVAKEIGVKVIVDTKGEPLINALQFNPFLIKPNKEELEDLFGRKLNSIEEIREAANKLIEYGAENVIVSLGNDGAYMIGKETNEAWVKPYEGTTISTVGAGDSLIAGFLYEYIKSNDMYKALKTGVYVGTATAYSSSLATKDELIEALKRIG